MAFWKHCGKSRKVCIQHFLIFPQFFVPYQREIELFEPQWNCRLQLLFSLDKAKILSYGTRLQITFWWQNINKIILHEPRPGGCGERVGLMTWRLWVRSPVEATFLSGVFSPLTSAEACEKSSRWLWKEKVVLVLVWESQEIYVRHRPPWYDLSC